MLDSLTNVASLREQNLALQAELAEAEAALVAVTDQLARLEFFEEYYDQEVVGTDIGQTVAQVIGQPALEGALIIDKGTSDGVVVGQPVITPNGYVVGSVEQATSSTATVVPITVGPSGVAVAVGDQVGVVVPQIDTNVMRLDLDAQEPVFAGDLVVTSSGSIRFPAGFPVGEVLADAAPANDSLSTQVQPHVQPDTLRVVVVLAWPPDPVTAATPETTTTTSTTSTTLDGESTTSTSTTLGDDG
jgi:rod shape-determining protein MreC